MIYKKNHGYTVGQIIRDGNQIKEIVFVFGSFYSAVKYKANGPLFSEPKAVPAYQEDSHILKIINTDRPRGLLKFR